MEEEGGDDTQTEVPPKTEPEEPQEAVIKTEKNETDTEYEEEGEGGVFDDEPTQMMTDDSEVEEEQGVGEDLMEEDINVTDSQVMIQLKEAEEEADALRKEIAKIKAEIDDYQCREVLTQKDEKHLRDLQMTLMDKLAVLDELTKRIAKLMEFSGRDGKSEETTVLEEEEEEGFPDDLLPKVVICSSWDDMMPKVVVCMDMKKPNAAKKLEGERDENGLTPEQREALEQERRCMAEERNRLQYQIACMEGEMRVMMRENDLLSRRVAQLKADLDNQPPFEFEMSVSATQGPGRGCPKTGNIDMGYGVMGPNAAGNYTMGAALSPGAEVQGKLAVGGPQMFPQPMIPGPQMPCNQPGNQNVKKNGQLPCGGINGIPGKSVPCPRLQPPELIAPANTPTNEWTAMLPPHGKKCRKDFNAAQGCEGCGGGGTCCGGGNMPPPTTPTQGIMPSNYPPQMTQYSPNFNPQINQQTPMNCEPQSFLPPGFMKQPPMDVNFKVNVQPQTGPCDKKATMNSDARSNKIAQQLQEIEMELRRMQRDLCKAKKDKETLKAQQATLNCAKNFIM